MYPWHPNSDIRKVLGIFLCCLSSVERGATPGLLGQARSVTKISPGPHRAQMASQLGLSRLAVCYSRSRDGRSTSEGELHPWSEWSGTRRMPWLLSGLLPGKTIGPGMRLLLLQEVLWCESQETVSGLQLVWQRWVVVEIFRKLWLFFSDLIHRPVLTLLLTHHQHSWILKRYGHHPTPEMLKRGTLQRMQHFVC